MKERALVVTRIFGAPRELVWKAWTEAERLMCWWGPKNFTTPFCNMDVRPGGAYRICIRSAEGIEYWMRGTYREIVEPKRLAFSFAWEEPKGTPGFETLVAVTFAAFGEKTKLIFHQALFASVTERDRHQEGWAESFDRLAGYLTKA